MAKLVNFRRKDTLDEFIAHYEGLPWTPGEKIDCCLILAEWLIWNGYPDPAIFRGTYTAGQGQIDVLANNGGAVSVVDKCVSTLNLRRTDNPSRGDIGVVGSPINITRQFGVIHDGNGWISRTRAGFIAVTARTLSAWEI